MIKQGYEEFFKRFEANCTENADYIALSYIRNDKSKIQFTFREFFNKACVAKDKFLNHGLKPGDRNRCGWSFD